MFPTFSSSLKVVASAKLSGGESPRPTSLSVVNFQIIFPTHSTYTYINTWYYISIFCLFHTYTMENSSKEDRKASAYD